MKRVMLVLAYDGTHYCGWQKQDNGITIEEVINRELSRLLHEEISVIGASRTDSGVHALGNVCIFDTESKIPGEKFCYALNVRLPDDIRVQSSCDVKSTFHPRHTDSIKTYEYNIWNHKFPNPMLQRYTKFCYFNLNIEAMQEAAKCLVGKHDFASFCSAHSQAETTVREVTRIEITSKPANELPLGTGPAQEAGQLITIHVEGYGFLYNMVRIIVGTLLKIGMGMIPASDMEKILAACDRSAAGPKADACGLTMVGLNFLIPEDYSLDFPDRNEE